MQIRSTQFDGCNAVELTTDAMTLVAVTDFGPRIAALSKPGQDSILLWDTEQKYVRENWHLRGGHRVWATRPLADECEDTYSPDNEACEVTTHATGFKLLGAEDPVNKTRRGLAVTVLDDRRIDVDNFVVNTGEMLYSAGVWSLTCTLPGASTRYVVPLGDGSSWDYCNMVMFRTWAGHDGGFDDSQFSFENDAFVIRPAGRENKRMLAAQKGVMAMIDDARQLTFIKRVQYDAQAQYPLNCNMAFYVGPGNFMVEMETMGPERTLKPGESAHNVETWELHDRALPNDELVS